MSTAARQQTLRVLLLADTHLGLDLPAHPRVDRPRRGPDFFANTEAALAPARAGEVDLVVHGGDLLYRSRVGAALVQAALEPLLQVADRGVPVVLVPGNHERSAIPHTLFATHPSLHVLDRPRTLRLDLAGRSVAVAGFPCVRDGVAPRFGGLVRATGALAEPADVRLLCLHQTVEGARVGPKGFTFRPGPDVVTDRDLPAGFAAVLAGHIHRHQVLERDLAGRPLAAPVLYPGAIERTSAAERDEPKGYLRLELEPGPDGGRLVAWAFVELPARPWIDVEVPLAGVSVAGLQAWLGQRLAAAPGRAIVRLRLPGPPPPDLTRVLRAAPLRALAGPDQIVELTLGHGVRSIRAPELG
jgi:DNA repair protein SbcD/Mre11